MMGLGEDELFLLKHGLAKIKPPAVKLQRGASFLVAGVFLLSEGVKGEPLASNSSRRWKTLITNLGR
jgi:hypothetical protein